MQISVQSSPGSSAADANSSNLEDKLRGVIRVGLPLLIVSIDARGSYGASFRYEAARHS